LSAFYRHTAELNKISVDKHPALDLIQFSVRDMSRTDLAVKPGLIGMGVTKINAVVHITFEQENYSILEFPGDLPACTGTSNAEEVVSYSILMSVSNRQS
jgi:hypothetical protein